jgi:hypothetical protein
MLAAQGAAALTPAQMAPHRQTVAEMTAVSSAIIAWLSDQVGRALLPGDVMGTCTADLADYPAVTPSALAALLVPQYIASVPSVDAWGHAYDYHLQTNDLFATHVALLRSAGSDGVFEGTVYACGAVDSLAADLVWADDGRVRWPGPELIELRQRQARAQADIHNVGTAMFSWLTDQVGRRSSAQVAATVDLSLFTPISAADLAQRLVPFYIFNVPTSDGWGIPYDYYLDAADVLGPEVMAIRSRGRDGAAEGTLYDPGTYPASDLGRDTVWADGLLVRGPDAAGLAFLDDLESGDLRFWAGAAAEP